MQERLRQRYPERRDWGERRLWAWQGGSHPGWSGLAPGAASPQASVLSPVEHLS